MKQKRRGPHSNLSANLATRENYRTFICELTIETLLKHLSYFAAGAGVAVVAGAPAVLEAFLFFFTCFFATGAEESAGAGVAVCAASDRPAVARAKESPSIAEVIFFMVIVRSFFRGAFFLPLYLLTKPPLTLSEHAVKLN
jgi:hypothetical protein